MLSVQKINLSVLIKEKARKLNFDLCGIAKPRKLSERAVVLQKWCEEGMNDKMSYLERNIGKRTDPKILFPGVKSMIVVGLSYYSDLRQKDPDAPLLSRYAYGTNYHNAIGGKLERMLEFIRTVAPGCEEKIFVDSGPLLEKAWAIEAGLGWQGKHSIVISREIGSFFFIGVLLLNIALEFDKPHSKNYCGKCRLCIDFCPTGAINDNGTIDARKCIANLTVENRGPVPEDIVPKLGGRVYGCDRCQEVCPWNKDIKPNEHPEFAINEKVAYMSREDWQSLTEEQFNTLFRDTALERVKFTDLKRNIADATRSMIPKTKS